MNVSNSMTQVACLSDLFSEVTLQLELLIMKKVLLKLMSEYKKAFHYKNTRFKIKEGGGPRWHFFVLPMLGYRGLNCTKCLIHGQEICDF